MELTPVDAPTPRPGGTSAPAAPAAGRSFDAALHQAMATPAAAPDRPLTLGQMLRVYAGPGALPGLGVTSPAAPPSAATPAVARPPASALGGELGIGPVVRPLPGEVGSAHGPRHHPIHGDLRMHHGVDIGAPTGTPIHAFAAGTVTHVGPRGGYGNLVIVEHPGGLETRYAHQSAMDVVVGQRVEAGQVVGRVGATGTATGPHLHFELRRDGTSIDPAPYLP